MATHDIFVIGASAGGVEALQKLVAQLPADLPAAVFVVMHLPSHARSLLPQILTAAGSLPAMHPNDGEPIRNGRIFIAPPDKHLVLQRGHIHLSVGPKEQHHRPSINVTFRSAAQAYEDRVTGVILTGGLDDGTAGLWEIKRHGGVAVVQDPEEAVFSSMPLSALREVQTDYIVRLSGMAQLIVRLATRGEEQKVSLGENMETEAKLTDLTCPDCRGTIWEVNRGGGHEYFCRVGHRYSAKAMLAEHFAAQEKALYAAIVALEEGASLASQLAHHFDPDTRDKLLQESREHRNHAEKIRGVLAERQSFSLD